MKGLPLTQSIANSGSGRWLASAANSYEQKFRLNVNNLALVLNFNFQKNIGLQLSADVFQISQLRQAVYVVCNTIAVH